MVLFLSGLVLVLVAAVLWLALQRRESSAEPVMNVMQQQIEALRQQVSVSMNSVSQNLQRSSGDMNQRLDNAAKIFTDLNTRLGQLSQANTQILGMVKDVATLQDILRPPKLRGGMGEVMLENLLREILPAQHYTMQHHFRTGNIVDAVIRLKEGLVPVDAKFPLENFRRMLEATNDGDRLAARKEFARNVKKHIDDIHDRYILTEEGTFPFALMYIPAENVYYETIIRNEEEDGEKALYAYATSRQVMPVSPNSFYAYLLTLSQGFRGMRIEERAREVIDHLNRLQMELAKFSDDFRTVGTHLTNAQTRYRDAEKRLTRFEEKLLAAGDAPPSPAPTIEAPLS